MTQDQTMQRPRPRDGILDIAAYVPGSNKANFVGTTYKLSANESPFAPSQKAIDAYCQVGQKLALYPDGSARGLRQAIGAYAGIAADQIMIGNGSDELLGLLANTYLRDGDEAIITEHGFSVYEIQIRGAGARPISVKEKACKVDPDAIHQALTDKTRMVFIANPGNPTGTYLTKADIAALHAGLPQNVMLVLDSAYAEFVQNGDYHAGIDFVAQHDNVVMTRTFSKIYGLAALRIGWMYAPLHVIDAVNRIRGAFSVNSAAQAAGIAAIEDQDYITNAVQYYAKWRAWLTEELRALHLEVTPSVTNFLLVHFPHDSNHCASAADAYLKAHGFIVRRVDGYGFPHSLRISIGSEEANRGMIDVLKQFLK